MYLDKPKSPSFTQSTEDTRTFRAAMSLKKEIYFRMCWVDIYKSCSFYLISIINMQAEVLLDGDPVCRNVQQEIGTVHYQL